MKLETIIEVKSEEDIIEARQSGRFLAEKIGFNDVDQAQVVTAISELARNIFLYAGSGSIHISFVKKTGCKGLMIKALDDGPGINDLHEIMEERYHTHSNTGGGILAVKRIMDDFSIQSKQGDGTEIEVTKWMQQMEVKVDAR